MIERVSMANAEIDQSDIDSVLAVLKSGRIAMGPQTEAFEKSFRDYIGCKHALAVSSGTTGLHMLVRALDIKEGDEVLVPSFTFAASVNAFLFERATPVFVDIENETYNLDPIDLERKITSKTKAIMAVDVFGHPADWDAINTIASKRDIAIIDDSCEALGAEYKGQRLGRMGKASVFAFYPNKQITTGEGGLVTTDDDRVAAMIRSLRNQGRREHGAWLEHENLGYNYRIDEMSAALGASQMKRLESFLNRRERVAKLYTQKLQGIEWLKTPVVKSNVRMSWFVYVVTLAKGLSRDKVMKQMAERGIPTRGYFAPIHQQHYLKSILKAPVRLPVTEDIAERTMALPFSAIMTEDEVDLVVETLRSLKP